MKFEKNSEYSYESRVRIGLLLSSTDNTSRFATGCFYILANPVGRL
ncbi:MAG: hypothetical protein PUP93_23155 [Rhizonema sp. NSF051]|nr:hypothetical protein [Rhizonema sp. NSF051]